MVLRQLEQFKGKQVQIRHGPAAVKGSFLSENKQINLSVFIKNQT